MGFATEKVNLISSNIYNKGDKKWLNVYSWIKIYLEYLYLN